MIDYSAFEEITLLVFPEQQKIFATIDPASFCHGIDGYLLELVDLGYSHEKRGGLGPNRILKHNIGLAKLYVVLWETGEQEIFFADEPVLIAIG